MELSGPVAFVTGASDGIGARIAAALASVGVDLLVGYHGRRDGALKTCGVVADLGRRAEVVHLDQTDPPSVETAIETAISRFGRVDVLVNNAAWNIGIPFPNLEALTIDIWDRIFATNTRGPFLLARAAARHMVTQGGGRIVNIASVGGLVPASSSIAYSCSKAALIHLTRCLAVALAPDVTVNCIARVWSKARAWRTGSPRRSSRWRRSGPCWDGSPAPPTSPFTWWRSAEATASPARSSPSTGESISTRLSQVGWPAGPEEGTPGLLVLSLLRTLGLNILSLLSGKCLPRHTSCDFDEAM
jgi:3-oxoacyl-[acyl-carrier protein] reductase